LSLAMMLRYTFNLTEWADRVDSAVKKTLSAGYRTADIATAGKTISSTSEMGAAVVKHL